MKQTLNDKKFVTLLKSMMMLCLIVNSLGCMKSLGINTTDTTKNNNGGGNNPATPVTGTGLTPITEDKLDGNCVQVFYDRSTDPNFSIGRTYALMLANLLGHFPEHQQVLGPIELYKKGDINRCYATFYIGAFYNNVLPADFLTEWKTTSKQAIWIGYNYWQLGLDFEKEFGYKDYSFTTLDNTNRTPAPENKPSFFRDVQYKGETFTKYNEWSATSSNTFVCAFEQTKLLNKTSDVAEVMATAKHSFSNEVIPWALHAGNRFYVAELPFSYIHEGDRYFVFADLMFDFLKAPARHDSKNALIRIEDIHALVELNYLDEAVNIMKSNGVTPHIMLVPIYDDPLYANQGHAGVPIIRMENYPNFTNLLGRYKNEGTVFIWHGVTHQYSNIKNPFTGASGDDYEFWNSISTKPIAEDSVNYVLDRMDDGFKSLKSQGIRPQFWVTPHYNGSALDNIIFGQIFPWLVSRGVYCDYTISGIKPLEANKALYFDLDNTAGTSQNRREYLSTLKVEMKGAQFGQLFPYEIYGDIFSQNVIPENLGNVQPYLSNQVTATRTVDKILSDAKRNLVLRDVWASAFYHPFLLDPKLNSENADASKPKDLQRLVTGIKALGYRFVNLNDYAVSNQVARGKPRLELETVRK